MLPFTALVLSTMVGGRRLILMVCVALAPAFSCEKQDREIREMASVRKILIGKPRSLSNKFTLPTTILQTFQMLFQAIK